jgi:hypothetical protein
MLGVLHDWRQAKPLRLLAYFLLPNPWHLPLWPEQDRQLDAFMRRLTAPTGGAGGVFAREPERAEGG